MKKRSKVNRPSRVIKNKKPLSRNVLYLISAAIVLTILSAGIQQPQRTELQAQTASVSAVISPPPFGCIGNCPLVITPAISQAVVSPAAAAPVVPAVSGTVSPAVSGNPQNPAAAGGVGGAANPAGQQPAGNPLQFLENPNGKVPPGRAKHFLEQFFAFLMQLFGGGNANGQNQQGQNGGDAPNNPIDPNANPALGGNQGKPGYGNNPGTVNPGGHMVEPQSEKKIEQQEQQEKLQQQQAQQGASVPGALNQPGATNGGAVNPQAKQQNGFTAFLNLIQQLFGGQPANK